MKLKLDTRFTRYNDYDVSDFWGIYRACVPFDIKQGDIFNVKAFDEIKFGCEWLGDLESSLQLLTQKDLFLERYLEAVKKEVGEYSEGIINYKEEPIPNNHLFCIRGQYADFYQVQNFIYVFVKLPQARIKVLKTQLA